MQKSREGERMFEATLALPQEPISPRALGTVLAAYPPMALKAVSGIHRQAFKRWLKGTRFFSHPRIRPLLERAAR